MGANTFGRNFSLTTFGESHGPAIGGVIDGCPPGIEIDLPFLQALMAQRRPGQSSVTTPRTEQDSVQLLSGIFEGKTTGAPIGLLIQNEDARSQDYDAIKNAFRPGHADYVYTQKYGHYDYRGGGRASARETAVRVAAGAIAQMALQQQAGIQVKACLVQMGAIKVPIKDWAVVSQNPFYVADVDRVPEMQAYIAALKAQGDSIGAKVHLEAHGVPSGLGEPIYHKLEADIAAAMLSINAVKGVSFGAGFGVVEQLGSEHRDEMGAEGFLSNEAGGITAGISTGQPICVDIAIKPPSSIRQAAQTLTKTGEATQITVTGRHDPCVGIRAVPVAQAMLAIVLLDHWLFRYGNAPR